ncbi:hypothetical protein LAZ67_1007099 [Cordylochernes scorpioides]|uniref:Uncharacterized protein n=1 Tax=Cordylochernes scorpioides TaxID=51811 RepID=A0ABY6K232_9ARAC|nr:hypothetical protein LAZ67_1007099 [Cordylochernes scorpioides]
MFGRKFVGTPGNETVTRRSRRLQGLQPELSTVFAFPARKNMEREREDNRPFFHQWKDPTVFSCERGEDSQRCLSDFQRVARYKNVVLVENIEEILNAWEKFKMKKKRLENPRTFFELEHRRVGKTPRATYKKSSFFVNRATPECRKAKRHLLEKDISTADQFVGFCRRFEALRRMRVAPSRFNRLPNVTTISTAGPENLESLIRRIVREEVQKFLATPSIFAAQDIDTSSPDLRGYP